MKRSHGFRDWLRRVRRAAGAGAQGLADAASTVATEYRIKYELTICLNFKNAAPYLAEWLEFHQIVGVEHFYLYNNNSADNYQVVLEPYIRAGIVTLNEWPQSPAFPASYEHCVQRHGHEARWIAFLDDDEFLFPTVHVNLRKVLRNYQRYPAVAVHWILFGSSGHLQRPPGLVVENYLKCGTDAGEIKSIVNPRQLAKVLNPHYCKYKHGAWAVDENKRPVEGAYPKPATAEVLRINHYTCKSLEDWKNKMSRGTQEIAENPYNMQRWQAWEQKLNAAEDRNILRFLPELKRRLEARRREGAGAAAV
jgi:hypothetical protein